MPMKTVFMRQLNCLLWTTLCFLNQRCSMRLIQRKYKIIRAATLKDLGVEVNELLEREYKDTEGYLYVSSGRWQCLGSPFKEEDRWLQAVVFVQTEE